MGKETRCRATGEKKAKFLRTASKGDVNWGSKINEKIISKLWQA